MSLGLEGLAIKRVITFNNYYHVYVKEVKTQRTAFALKLIKLGLFGLKKFPSRYPQMMWNSKYGQGAPEEKHLIDDMVLGLSTAEYIAKDVVEKLGASYSLSKNPDTYYGFFEFIISKGNQAVGEVSINGNTGKVLFRMYPKPPSEFKEFI